MDLKEHSARIDSIRNILIATIEILAEQKEEINKLREKLELHEIADKIRRNEEAITDAE